MANFSQRFIRSIIEEVWEQAGEADTAFLDLLKAGRSGYWRKTSSGWQVTASSGAGYSTSFHIPDNPSDPQQMTPASLQDLFQNIIENYRIVVADGLSEGGDAAGNPQFLAAILALFPTIKGTTNNFMYLNP